MNDTWVAISDQDSWSEPRSQDPTVPVAVGVRDAERAGRLTGSHRDPFDRMLIAQALAHDLAIVSNARVFDSYGVNRLW